MGCHSYNVINISGNALKIATIDTMLSFYLAFIYADRPYYDTDRLLCMSQYLFKVQQKNRLQQKGLLRRFSISCYGDQTTLESMRQEKTEKFEELKNKKNSREYEEWFLKYTPDKKKTTQEPKKGTQKKQKKQKRRKGKTNRVFSWK